MAFQRFLILGILLQFLSLSLSGSFLTELPGYCHCEYNLEDEVVRIIANNCNSGFTADSMAKPAFYHSSYNEIICECVCVLEEIVFENI